MPAPGLATQQPRVALSTRIGTAIGALCLVIVSTALALGAVELWFRHEPGTSMPLYALDEELGWVHQPNLRRPWGVEGTTVTIETDGAGLRPPFHRVLTGRPVVLLLGDSFLDGLDVESEHHLATLLQAARPELEIRNAGVSGYSTLQELLLARRLAPLLRPRARVLFVYGNDVHDNLMPYYPLLGPRPWVDAEGRHQPIDWKLFERTLPPVPLAGWLHRHSLAFFRLESAWAMKHGAEANARARSLIGRVPRMTARWALLEQLVGELARDGALLLVACPPRGDVERAVRPLAQAVDGVGARLGVTVVDPQPYLTVEHYFRENIHWNAGGHRVVADVLAPALDAMVSGKPIPP